MLAEFLRILLLGNVVFALLVLLASVLMRLSRQINASSVLSRESHPVYLGCNAGVCVRCAAIKFVRKTYKCSLYFRLWCGGWGCPNAVCAFGGNACVFAYAERCVARCFSALPAPLFSMGSGCGDAFGVYSLAKDSGLIERRSENVLEEAHRQLAAMCRRLGIRQTVRLVCCPGLGSPTALGVLHPRIILTERVYSETKLYYIFKHELIHIQRKDLAFWHFALLLTALSWFNPTLHWMLHRLHFDCEAACDERVLCGENDCARQAYTRTILDSMCRVVPPGGSLLNLSGGDKTMKKRLLAIRLWKENYIRTRTKAFACAPAQSSALDKMDSAELQISTSAIAEKFLLVDEQPAASAKEQQGSLTEAQKEDEAESQDTAPEVLAAARRTISHMQGLMAAGFWVTEQPAEVTVWRAGVVSRVEQQYVGAGFHVHVCTADGIEDVYGSFS